MKISWGHKIAFVYITFTIGIGFLVWKASSQKFDLVTKDYYEQELRYQQVIDQAKNANSLSAPVKVSIRDGAVTVNFPDEMKAKKKLIDFYLYCPSDARKDFRKKIEAVDIAVTTQFPNGLTGYYELKLSWEAEGIKYYHEEKILL